LPKIDEVIYRKPRVYVPPYNYCDRWCERCVIDKTRCLLYQREMDDQLHREIDGLGDPTPEEEVERMKGEIRNALRMVEEQVREMGLDPEALKREAAKEPRRKPRIPPIVEKAAALARGVSDFLRANPAACGPDAPLLRRYMILAGPKLGRASEAGEEEIEVADAILQAQVAHRALGDMSAALRAVAKRSPSLGDGALDLQVLIQGLRREIEERWLTLPCDLLEPARDGPWWGPLRDVSATLKQFRRP
jgi:hypothetical protein